MTHANQSEGHRAPSKAVLVSAERPRAGSSELTRTSAELASLARSLGVEVTHSIVQRRAGAASSAFLGGGKLEELVALTAKGADTEERSTAQPELVLVNAALTPSQQRALEQATGLPVWDRTWVVLQVFERHARTREARLQVELARLLHELPRLRDDGRKASRTGGGGGRGERGHTDVELAKQRTRQRIAELERQLEAVRRTSHVQRDRRQGVQQVALVGYTNAGKSSWMRALTGSHVLVRDELFATLGTTTRALESRRGPRLLVSDTVGFMEDLPHELLASFRSTLEQTRDADLLLLVADAADPNVDERLDVSRDTLARIGVAEVPTILLLNKCDLVDERRRAELAACYPNAVFASAHDPEQVDGVRRRIEEHFERQLQSASLLVPFRLGRLLGSIRVSAHVSRESHTAEGVLVDLRGSTEQIAAWQAELAREGGPSEL